jgi:hypothetical protein
MTNQRTPILSLYDSGEDVTTCTECGKMIARPHHYRGQTVCIYCKRELDMCEADYRLVARKDERP